MSYANSKVTVPVSISDVKAAVGYNSDDLATLINNGTINIWAKYKPVAKIFLIPSRVNGMRRTINGCRVLLGGRATSLTTLEASSRKSSMSSRSW